MGTRNPKFGQPKTSLGRKLKEKRAVCILTEKSAEKAMYQFVNKFIPSRFVVTCPGPEGFKDSWCLLVYLDPDVMERLRGYLNPAVMEIVKWSHSVTCSVAVWSGALLPDYWVQWLESAVRRYSRYLPGSRCPGSEAQFVIRESFSRRNFDGSVVLILDGLFDAPQRRWKKFDAVVTSFGLA